MRLTFWDLGIEKDDKYNAMDLGLTLQFLIQYDNLREMDNVQDAINRADILGVDKIEVDIDITNATLKYYGIYGLDLLLNIKDKTVEIIKYICDETVLYWSEKLLAVNYYSQGIFEVDYASNTLKDTDCCRTLFMRDDIKLNVDIHFSDISYFEIYVNIYARERCSNILNKIKHIKVDGNSTMRLKFLIFGKLNKEQESDFGLIVKEFMRKFHEVILYISLIDLMIGKYEKMLDYLVSLIKKEKIENRISCYLPVPFSYESIKELTPGIYEKVLDYVKYMDLYDREGSVIFNKEMFNL